MLENGLGRALGKGLISTTEHDPVSGRQEQSSPQFRMSHTSELSGGKQGSSLDNPVLSTTAMAAIRPEDA